MELGYCWREFQKIFYPKAFRHRRKPVLPDLIVLERDKIVYAFFQGKVHLEWSGKEWSSFIPLSPSQDCFIFTHDQLDEWLVQTTQWGGNHYLDQANFLKKLVFQSLKTKKGKTFQTALITEFHFFLRVILKDWKKFLPRSYGICLFFQGKNAKALVLMFKEGRLVGINIPDLSGMFKSQRNSPQSIINYLSQEYQLWLQGFFMPWETWEKLANAEKPWMEVLKALKKDRSLLVPFRLRFYILIWIWAHRGF